MDRPTRFFTAFACMRVYACSETPKPTSNQRFSNQSAQLPCRQAAHLAPPHTQTHTHTLYHTHTHTLYHTHTPTHPPTHTQMSSMRPNLPAVLAQLTRWGGQPSRAIENQKANANIFGLGGTFCIGSCKAVPRSELGGRVWAVGTRAHEGLLEILSRWGKAWGAAGLQASYASYICWCEKQWFESEAR